MSRSVILGAAIVLTLAFTPGSASAQIDLTGQWAAYNMHDARTRGPGPDLVDWSTIPLSEEGRARAQAYSYSMISMPERMCMHWSQNYIAFAPHAIMIERIDDPVNGNLIGVGVSSGGSDRSPMPIWLDGRPRPPANADHTFGGFTLGKWEGAMLTGEMTHMKEGLTARNGAPLSDQAKMTIHWVRHGNILTLMTITEDPIYLTAPYVQSGSYRLNLGGNANPVNAPCYPITEVPRLDTPGTVPHYLPNENPYLETFAQSKGLPLEAVLGGADHVYPEYRAKLKDTYRMPPPCRVADGGRQDCIIVK
jgi:hypothetical protein